MIIGGKRLCGKTTQLIKKASEDKLYIVCADSNRARNIAHMARHMKLDIPFPITVDELPLRSPHIKEVLVDDIENVLSRIIRKPIVMASTSMELKQLGEVDHDKIQ